MPYTKLTQNGLKTQLIYLEENIKEKYQDTGFDNELLAMSLKAQTTKANKQAYAKLTKLLHRKGHIIRVQTVEWEQILAYYASEFNIKNIYTTHKYQQQKRNSINGQRTSIKVLQTFDMQMANKQRNRCSALINSKMKTKNHNHEILPHTHKNEYNYFKKEKNNKR